MTRVNAVAGRTTERPRLTVRARFVTAAVTLAALGMVIAGGTAYLLQRERVDVLIDDSLTRNVEEFRQLAVNGVDPSTGAGFTTVRDLLYVALQRTVPAANEGMLAVVDGEVPFRAIDAVRLRPERVPELVAAAVAAQQDDVVSLGSVDAQGTTYRYATIPVTVRGDTSAGVLVFAFDRQAEHAELVRTYRTFALVALGCLAVLALVGWVVAGRLLAPIRLLRRTAQRISDSDLSDRIPVQGTDDLSDLARTVNSMLDRLERAFRSQRELLDDAGHELRTPLTIIRGHVELMDTDDPADVADTRTLVLDELDRMHRLVEDLVVLATADRPDFVRPAPTDVGLLTDDVLDKARTLGGHRWVVEGRAEGTVVLDAQRITQAWLQLAANAAKFAPPGSTVRLGSALDRGRLLLTVHDTGPGVRAEDAQRIFERFARGQAGRGVDGAGLGLPIVDAIAAAHGGVARVDPTPASSTPGPDRAGPGARFTIDLPLAAVPAPSVAAPSDGAPSDGAPTPDGAPPSFPPAVLPATEGAP
ncbi:cell wall metabolism sensor histidine kinase WalK [Actinotalea sp. K2]|uniref:sensor histidine kinase n=1 Tax=Actinotalea sp. K2 TaxID=2939438 RepID=UPI0020170A84|nr:HAMP domain-containing sensor histidine kinase [Actinotalea sp. K2]MCL3860054.1 HAMP domain-containing histidine kinase [Actinotalea sp. K2]